MCALLPPLLLGPLLGPPLPPLLLASLLGPPLPPLLLAPLLGPLLPPLLLAPLLAPLLPPLLPPPLLAPLLALLLAAGRLQLPAVRLDQALRRPAQPVCLLLQDGLEGRHWVEVAALVHRQGTA